MIYPLHEVLSNYFQLPLISKWLPTDLNYLGITWTITVAGLLPTLIVWELIRQLPLPDRYRL